MGDHDVLAVDDLEGPAVVVDAGRGHDVVVGVDAGGDGRLGLVVALELDQVHAAVDAAVDEGVDFELDAVLVDDVQEGLDRHDRHLGADGVDDVDVAGRGQGQGGLADAHGAEGGLAGLAADDRLPGHGLVDHLGDASGVEVQGLAEGQPRRGEVQDVVPGVLAVDLLAVGGVQDRRADHAGLELDAADDAGQALGELAGVRADVEGAPGLVVGDVAVGAGVEVDLVAVLRVQVDHRVGDLRDRVEEGEEGQDGDVQGAPLCVAAPGGALVWLR